MNKDFGFKIDDKTYEEFINFKRRENNAVYGLDTGEGRDAWTTVKITTPAFNDISDNINKILEDKYIMDRLSKACIRDEQALYVRELLNRIGWCIRWLDESRSHGFNTDIPIAILKMDKETLEREYETICDLRSLDNYYRVDGEDVLAEILEGNNKPIRKMYSTQLLDEYYIIKENWNALRNRVEEHKKHEGLPGMDEAFDMVIEDMNELEMRGER